MSQKIDNMFFVVFSLLLVASAFFASSIVPWQGFNDDTIGDGAQHAQYDSYEDHGSFWDFQDSWFWLVIIGLFIFIVAGLILFSHWQNPGYPSNKW